MATYKVLQDVEAEDKLVGPLSLRQFVYAAITVFFGYLSFFAVTKNVSFLLAFFVPPALFTAFLAVPWHGDQPTEVWAIAKLRFFLKPRKRIWDQSGAKNLVTITVPKKIERRLTDGLSQTEVRSRLYALATTIDSRGWAVKNSYINMSTQPIQEYASDRLVEATMLPQEVSNVDVSAADDILDEKANPIAHHFDSMISDAASTQRQQLMQTMQAPQQPTAATAQPPQAQSNTAWAAQPQTTIPQPQQPANYWYQGTGSASPIGTPAQPLGTMPPPTSMPFPPFNPALQAAEPTPAEKALLEQSTAANEYMDVANDHLKRIKTPEELAAEQQAAGAEAAQSITGPPQSSPIQATQATDDSDQKAQVTSEAQADIINLAHNDDLNVATIARQANKKRDDDQEVVISLR